MSPDRISSVVSPPRTRSVSATRASFERTGWQAVKMRPRRSSPVSSSIALYESRSDLLSRHPAEDAKRERDPCVLREDWMAGGEDEAEEIVPRILVDRPV